MTDKYTREQKIERLQELLAGCERRMSGKGIANAWLCLAEGPYWDTRQYTAQDEAQCAWDVHTGLAFTKLYRALK